MTDGGEQKTDGFETYDLWHGLPAHEYTARMAVPRLTPDLRLLILGVR